MARYPKRQKVKRYRRSFYTREMRLKKGIGIAVLVVAVLAAAWFAAPHVLDWATHTWYTVVKDRDLEAESASRAEAAASSAAASSAAASQAASSEPEPEEEKPLDGKAITGGSWAELDVTALTDDAAIRAAARQLKQQGADYALVTLKDAAGTVYYASGVAAAAQSITENPVDAANIAAILREEGIIPAAQLAAFTDPVSVYTDRSMGVHYDGNSLWLDNVSAAKGGKAWMNPFAASAVQYIGDLIEEVQGMGYEQVVLTGVQFPNIITRKQDFGASGGKSREGRAAQLTADIAAWQTRFAGSVTLLFAGAGFLFAGWKLRTGRRMRKKISNIVGNAPYMKIQEIADAIPCNYAKCCKHLENCIDKGMFGENAYLDMRTGTLVVRGAPPAPQPAPAAAPKAQPEEAKAEDNYAQILNQLRALNDAIPGEEMSDKISRLEAVSAKIFAQAKQNPDKLPQMRKFMDYYLPTALKLLKTYAELDAQGVEGENIRESKQRIEQVMDTLVTAFEAQLDRLFEDDALDVSTDIDVMENMLRADGLTGNTGNSPKLQL